ncbi:MAG: hypothetical protein ACPKQO_10205 [Nitrososphaeraceae archaeon]
MNHDNEIDLDKFFGKHVCIYQKDLFKEEGIIIYWESEYNGFRGTCKDCSHNWAQS